MIEGKKGRITLLNRYSSKFTGFHCQSELCISLRPKISLIEQVWVSAIYTNSWTTPIVTINSFLILKLYHWLGLLWLYLFNQIPTLQTKLWSNETHLHFFVIPSALIGVQTQCLISVWESCYSNLLLSFLIAISTLHNMPDRCC